MKPPNSSKILSFVPALYGLRYSLISQGEPLIPRVATPMVGGSSIGMQPTTTTRPAGNHEVNRSTPGSPEACRAPDSVPLLPDRDPVSRSTLGELGRGYTSQWIRKHQTKMPFIPNQHSVETFPAKRAYQPFHVCRRIGCAIGYRYPPDVHLLPEPHIVCRSARYPPSLLLDL